MDAELAGAPQGSAVLDGGWQAWNALALPLTVTLSGEERMPGADACFSAVPYEDLLIQTEELISRQAEITLIDARGANRYAGKMKPSTLWRATFPSTQLPVYGKSLTEGVFLSLGSIAARFHALKDKKVVSSCGSGVTACHNILAMVHADCLCPSFTLAHGVNGLLIPPAPLQPAEP